METNDKTARGFSLTEIAIVLGVIGIVLGALWSVMGYVIDSAKQHQLSQDITQVVGNVRSVYMSKASISGSTQALMFGGGAPGLINLGTVFPADMTGGTGVPPSAPWGSAKLGTPAAFSTFNICVWISGASTTCNLTNVSPGASPLFGVDVQNLSQANCIAAAVEDSGANMPPGLVDVYINGTSVGPGGGFGLPVTPANAGAKCNANASNIPPCAANSTGNCVDFVYRLNPPMTP